MSLWMEITKLPKSAISGIELVDFPFTDLNSGRTLKQTSWANDDWVHLLDDDLPVWKTYSKSYSVLHAIRESLAPIEDTEYYFLTFEDLERLDKHVKHCDPKDWHGTCQQYQFIADLLEIIDVTDFENEVIMFHYSQ